jgi:molybdopterin synthase catalytic subunit
MSDQVLHAAVVDTAVSTGTMADLVRTDTDGAVVTFEGVVRDHDHDRSVTALEYEAHPTATERITAVAESVAADHPEVRIAVEHRVGALGVGDVALAAAVASAHRQQAFAACADLIDRIKAEVPIWKRQQFVDGTDEWVGSL